jgi:hypothetical protein
MKLRFLKQHLSYKKDGVYDLEDGVSEYLVKLKVAEEVTEDEKQKVAPIKTEKKSPAGPNAKKK